MNYKYNRLKLFAILLTLIGEIYTFDFFKFIGLKHILYEDTTNCKFFMFLEALLCIYLS